MDRERYSAEQIIGKLREARTLRAKGRIIRQISTLLRDTCTVTRKIQSGFLI